MNQVPRSARRCRCEHPVLDDESCLLCGRLLVRVREPATARRAANTHDWTPAGVIRALKAFAFFRGRAPVKSDWTPRTSDDWPGLETVTGLFGSVEAAVRVAGIEGSQS